MFNKPDITDVRINDINYKWLQLQLSNISIYKLLENMNIENIKILKDNLYDKMIETELATYIKNISIIDSVENISGNNNIIIVADYKQYYDIFNTCSNQIVISIRHLVELTYFLYIEVEKILSNTNGAKVYIARQMLFDREYEAGNDYDKVTKTLKSRYFGNDISDFFINYYNDLNYTKDDIGKLFTPTPFIKMDNFHFAVDKHSNYINILNGERHTLNQPETYKNRIFLLGSCWASGVYAEDAYTIASYIQNYMKESKVVSYTGGYNNYNIQIFQYDILENDIVILFDVMPYMPSKKENIIYKYMLQYLELKGISYITFEDVLHNISAPICIDYAHTNHRGYKIAADYIYNNFLKYEEIKESNIGSIKQINNEYSQLGSGLENYKKYLISEKFNTESKNIGSIVMNCNPFSKGHLYLIEKALEKVEYLYIFIVEENRSFLDFQDRFNIVCENLSDKSNVKVLKSGKYIISTTTFPEYFSKESMPNIEIDTSLDMTIFAKEIAPVLNIKYRFAGNEPYCNITRQYNKSMEDILPKYNIEFIEIERLKINDVVSGDLIAISATKIRQYLKEDNMDALSQLVPKKTLDYLIALKKKGVI